MADIEKGTVVQLLDFPGPQGLGTVVNIRPDPAATEFEIKRYGGFIYTIKLSNPSLTEDGFYYCRPGECVKVAEHA